MGVPIALSLNNGLSFQMEENYLVQVALRIRPLLPSEVKKCCIPVIQAIPDLHQVKICGKTHTYNHVVDSDTNQNAFYALCIEDKVKELLKGYNVTVLAYGQTASGKTHTMGTTYSEDGDQNGVIPRALYQIFNLCRDNLLYDFTINVSFIELYRDGLYDLLAEKATEQTALNIREDAKGATVLLGVHEVVVNNLQEAINCLTRGSLRRATSATNVNPQSSRSHAIFTINIARENKYVTNQNKTAKFHIVDLAGSERPKKTGAIPRTCREGLPILENVICALADAKGADVPYRDSNLTRLLKDSLGGNTITLMVACVSPADYSMDETLSTLQYADKACTIKNKPVINHVRKDVNIQKLNRLVQQQRLELVGQGKHDIYTGRDTGSSKSGHRTTDNEIQVKQERHTARQVAMSTEHQELKRNLEAKERLARQMLATNHMVDDKLVRDHGAKIVALEKEKEELINELKKCGGGNNADGKVVEHTSRKFQYFESQLQSLRQTVQEQEHLPKLKEKDMPKIKKTDQMKQAKLQLIPEMQQERDHNKQRQHGMMEDAKHKEGSLKWEDEIAKLKNQLSETNLMLEDTDRCFNEAVVKMNQQSERMTAFLHQLHSIKLTDVAEQLKQCSEIQRIVVNKLEELVKCKELSPPGTDTRKVELKVPDFDESCFIVNDPSSSQMHVANLEKPMKRNADRGCMCKTNCSSRHCGCRKTSKQCGKACKCAVMNCQNREVPNTSLTASSADPQRETSSIEQQEVRLKRRKV